MYSSITESFIDLSIQIQILQPQIASENDEAIFAFFIGLMVGILINSGRNE